MLKAALERLEELLKQVRDRKWNHAQIEVAVVEIHRRIETLRNEEKEKQDAEDNKTSQETETEEQDESQEDQI